MHDLNEDFVYLSVQVAEDYYLGIHCRFVSSYYYLCILFQLSLLRDGSVNHMYPERGCMA